MTEQKGRPGPVYRLSNRLRTALDTLEARDAEALRRRYLKGETFEQIGNFLGVSRERTRQIVARAEKRLAIAYVRTFGEASDLRGFEE